MAKKKSFDMTQVLSIEDIIEMIKARKSQGRIFKDDTKAGDLVIANLNEC